MATERPPIVAPRTIVNSLADIEGMLDGQIKSDEIADTVAKMLRVAARNVNMLFEFTADDDGQFKPKNMGEIWFLVDMLLRAGMAPASYDNDPAKVAIGVMKAIEIGVEPISGLANIMIINNRPSVWGDLAQALIHKSGKVAKQTKETIGVEPAPGTELQNWPADFGYRVQMWRVGESEPYIGEFTVADAKRANLWMNTKKQPWITDPKAMLFNRARARAQRAGFADGLYGLALADEQMDYQQPAIHAQAAIAAPVDDDEPVTSLPAPEVQIMQDFGPGAEKPELQPVENSTSESPSDADTPTGQGDLLS